MLLVFDVVLFRGGTEFEDCPREDVSSMTKQDNLVVRPRQGRVLLFHNVDENGNVELGTLHRGVELQTICEK